MPLFSPHLKKIWHDPVWSVVIATGVIALLGLVGATIFDLWAAAWRGAGTLIEIALASSAVPNSVVLVGIVLSLVGLHQILRPIFLKERSTELISDAYCSDVFFELLWRWRYGYKDRIEDLAVFCPRCDLQIMPKDMSSPNFWVRFEYRCDDCNFTFARFDELPVATMDRVIMQIQKNLRTGEWRLRMESMETHFKNIRKSIGS